MDLMFALLGGCFGLVIVHMFTHGRRGRQWGRVRGTVEIANRHAKAQGKG